MAGRDRHSVEIQYGTNGIGVAIRVQLATVSQHAHPDINESLHRRRIADGLVDDQVGDDPRVGIGHITGGAVIGIGHLSARRTAVHIEGVAVLVIAELLVQQQEELLVGGAPEGTALHQVVVAAIHCTQSPGHLGIGQQFTQALPGSMRLGDENLLQDELEIGLDEIGHFLAPRIPSG